MNGDVTPSERLAQVAASAQPAHKIVAVVDCGTNSTRLLVVAAVTGEIVRVERITGLGRGFTAKSAETAELKPDAIERVLAALEEFAGLIEVHGVTEVRAVATSAAREAVNSDQLRTRAANSLGYPVELLSEHDEARYSFAGATTDLPAPRQNSELQRDSAPQQNSELRRDSAPQRDLAPQQVSAPRRDSAPQQNSPSVSESVLVVDIGGGSTEFAFGRTVPTQPDAELLGWQSLPLGSVRFTEQFLHSDPPSPEELSAAISVTRQYLDDIDREMPQVRNADRLLGVAGTITTLAAVELGLTQFDPARINNFVLTRTAAEEVFRTLATETLAERFHNPGLARDRAPVIVGGCCIAVAIMRHWDFDQCHVRHSDLLDGIAAELLAT